jgi:hypothetical protein
VTEQTVTLPYPAWMNAAERRANDALRRYRRLARAATHARRFVERRDAAD